MNIQYWAQTAIGEKRKTNDDYYLTGEGLWNDKKAIFLSFVIGMQVVKSVTLRPK